MTVSQNRTMVPRFLVPVALACLTLIVFPVRSSPTASTLDFEDLPLKTVVSKQYVARGVVVGPNTGVIDTEPKAHAGNRVLVASHAEFYTGPFVVNFTSGQSHVTLFAGATASDPNIAVRGTLRAFDAQGAQIAQDGPKTTIPNKCATPFEVKVGNPAISRIEIFLEGTDQNGAKSELPEAIDDLTFEGNAPPPVSKVPPAVQITAPIEQQQIDATMFAVQGTVAGDGLSPTAMLTLEVRQAANQPHLPPLITVLPLGGQGKTLTFSIPVKLGLGPQTLTVEAENNGGLKGSAQIHFANLPADITTRFNAGGGAATFGNLAWAVVGDGCTIAVYDQGAISDEAGAAHIVVNGIFDKWSQWILAKYDQLYAVGVSSFCPTEDEHAAPGGSRAQTFHNGRIYTHLVTGSLYVPGVFAQAIDQLGKDPGKEEAGEAATGVPLTDPKRSPAAKTWLFQQFVRPGQPGVASTLEIKGNTPTLWVERQGGELTALSEAGQVLAATSPTIVQRFPCAGGEGPCTVTPASSPPGVPGGNNAGVAYCGNDFLGMTPEWGAIRGDYSMTSLVGIVRASYMSAQDNPLTHEYSYDRVDPFHKPPLFHPSDWNVELSPIHPYKNVLAGNKDIDVEFEEYFAHYFFLVWGAPQAGDLLFAGGRWVIDCAHGSSEIHPPFVMADMRTETGAGPPVTVANVWVNGFYTGDPVDIDLFPPPRPSPNAFLFLNKPFDAQAAVDIEASFATDPDFFAFVRPHFTASKRHAPVTYTGEMKWQTGRGYMGRWSVGWETETQYPVQDLNKNWWP